MQVATPSGQVGFNHQKVEAISAHRSLHHNLGCNKYTLNIYNFHNVTIIKSQKDSINSLQDSDGKWFIEHDQMVYGKCFYVNIFQENETCTPFCLQGMFPRLDTYDLNRIRKDLNAREGQVQVSLLPKLAFVKDMVMNIRLFDSFVNVIWHCISSPSI
ncbi:hypothetical protein CR513_31002, partial [Mucuna pruriens]